MLSPHLLALAVAAALLLTPPLTPPTPARSTQVHPPARSLAVPGVRSGDRVTAIVRIGAVEVRAALVAVDAGVPGDVIRVSNKLARRVLHARVIGPGQVEVIHVR